MSELGPTADSPEHAATRRRKVMARQLLDDARDRGREIKAPALREVARLRWPNREAMDLEFVINQAILVANEDGDGPGSAGNGTEPAPAGPSTARDLCLLRLREDPETEYKGVLKEAKERGLWDRGRIAFVRGPWRVAKMKERKERTGSVRTRETRQKAARRSSTPDPTPNPPEEPKARERDVARPERADPAPAPVVDYRTVHGTLSVRAEGEGFRLTFHARLDRMTCDHLVPLLSSMLLANALDD